METNKSPSERSAGNLIKLKDNSFFLFGGGSREETFRDTWILKVNNDKEYTWQEVSLNKYIEPRFGSISACLNESIYIHGGQNYLEHKVYGDLHQIRLNDSKLEYVKNHTIYPINIDATPIERNSHAICHDDEKLYLFGGGNSKGLLDDLWSFDISTNKWARHEIKGKQIAHREMHGMVFYKDTKLDKSFIFIFGGRLYEGIDNNMYKIDLNDYSCEVVKTMPFPLCSFSFCLYDHFIFIYGGTDGNKFTNDIIIYNITNQKWAQCKFKPRTDVKDLGGRISSMMAVNEGKDYIVIFGGSFILKDSNDLEILSIKELLDSNNLMTINNIV
jgi:N-acetylneuraminic acid mutarotase